MRIAFAHVVEVELAEGADERAIGAAVTAELCGHWEHEPPCRWPHHTSVERNGSSVVARIVFACADDEEPEVRDRVVRGASSGRLVGPDGILSEWTTVAEAAVMPTPAESAKAARWSLLPGQAP